MTSLALYSKTLNFRGKSSVRPGRGLLRAAMGRLESDRIKTVLAQAEREGIQGTIPETLRDPRLVHVLARQFKVPAPSFEACQRYYRDHLETFRQPERYVGRQIVLRCASTDAMARAEAWARAERLIAILFFDSKMFGDLVATYDSISDESGSGRIGPVARGDLPPELDVALFGLRPGQIYPTPIVTDQGVHVIALDRILPGEYAPFAMVRDRISATLRNDLQVAAARRHLARLAERCKAAAE
jgi:peptidyl-prolyl cis-trans isomerase C